MKEFELPSNLDAERTILGAILLDNHAHAEAAEKLEAEDFFLDSHRRIFLRMGELIDNTRAVDIVTLAEEHGRHKEIESIGGVAYLAGLTEGLPRKPVIEEYIRIVKDKSLLRRLMLISSSAIARANEQRDSAVDVLESLSEQIYQVSEAGISSPLQTFGDFVRSAYSSIDDVFKHSAKSLGLKSGIRELDDLTCGFQRKDLIILAARPSVGKTSVALNFAAHAAVDLDQTVAFFSLEMPKVALLHRLVAQRSPVTLSEMREGNWNSLTNRYAMEALDLIVPAPIYIDDQKGQTIQKMQSKAARIKSQTGHLDLVIIDQLNHVKPPAGSEKYGNRRIDIGFLTRALKGMADALDVPVMVLHQLSRENEKRDEKRPRLSDLRESGDVEQDADLVIFPHRDSYYSKTTDEAESRKAEFIVAKQRQGPVGTVQCEYIREHGLWRNVEAKTSSW